MTPPVNSLEHVLWVQILFIVGAVVMVFVGLWLWDMIRMQRKRMTAFENHYKFHLRMNHHK